MPPRGAGERGPCGRLGSGRRHGVLRSRSRRQPEHHQGLPHGRCPLTAAVVLAAGLGTRLRPLTLLRPKCLCPLGDSTLLDLAIESVRPHTDRVAVNTHYLAEQVAAHLTGTDVHISPEITAPLGSAGAIGLLRDWIDGRDVLVRNADSYLTDDLSGLLSGWDGQRPRLLVVDTDVPADFGTFRYVGACLLPASAAARLPATRSSLYDLVWGPAWEADELDLVPARGTAIDCGTAADYLAANLHASGGRSVVGAGASVSGVVERCVVWPGARVRAGERLHDAVRALADRDVDGLRAGDDVTVDCGPPAGHPG